MHDSFRNQLSSIKKAIEKEKTVTLKLPTIFAFKDQGIYDFEKSLSFFDWSIKDRPVKIDLTECKSANYQTLSLLVLYAWTLVEQNCTVSFIEAEGDNGASSMWRRMGARGFMPILLQDGHNFNGAPSKPLLKIKSTADFKTAISTAESYTKDFNVEFGKTLRYVLSELLYNTLEHGKNIKSVRGKNIRIPSIAQFTWYQTHNEIHFIIADCGVGIKKHIEQTYPGQESHEEAIRLAIKPQVSGTFALNDPYTQKNNAGIGLFISSNIIRRLNAEMHILSGDGLLHISPRDVTAKTLHQSWPGTIVLVTLRLEKTSNLNLHEMMREFRDSAFKEQKLADTDEENGKLYLSIYNYFGQYAEDKEAAIKFRDKRITPAIDSGKKIVLDFDNVISAPHSFLSALIASPTKRLGMTTYKIIKITNATAEIRETIDFIFDENT
uniref:DUF4325 domain-containing protein n=1 Tax=Ectopseudomonas mendocina (strain ymp) TaxID=399739 RepID=A4XX40_ECTM1